MTTTRIWLIIGNVEIVISSLTLHQRPFDWRIAGMFLSASLLGMIAGRSFARRLEVRHLRMAFVWFVLAVGAFVIAKNWSYFL